jgi:ABC-type lipoprotein export system ATPase subunit
MHYLPDDVIEAHGDSIRNDAERLLTQLGLDITLLDLIAADLERERKVSGGQARVLSLVGPVLASQKAERAILLLDEPTSNLDEISAAKVATMLKTEVGPGATVVVVSHDKALDGFGKVLVMSKDENGRTVLRAQEHAEGTGE